MTHAELHAMLVEESVAATREILTADRNEHRESILAACRRRFSRMDTRASTAQLMAECPDMDEARSRWRKLVDKSIRRHIADLRPN